MPSSLIFAALAAAWLVVLVPIVAKRRQEVSRTTEAALSSRVLRRPNTRKPPHEHGLEVPMTGEELAEREHASDTRRYRPGRGGFDPEAAALAARARYQFRQRVVLALLVAVLASLVLALAVSSALWWVHGVIDVVLVGYLTYLRIQVRIEEEVRSRRAARLAGSLPAREAPPASPSVPEGEAEQRPDGAYHEQAGYHDEVPAADEQPVEERQPEPPVRRSPRPPAHPTAVAVDLDDEDPAFDDLGSTFRPPYRRAAGE